MYQSASLGTITFPVLSAHAVVGGMECVRNFLKWHHFEGRSSKAKAAGGSMNPASESSNPAGYSTRCPFTWFLPPSPGC